MSRGAISTKPFIFDSKRQYLYHDECSDVRAELNLPPRKHLSKPSSVHCVRLTFLYSPMDELGIPRSVLVLVTQVPLAAFTSATCKISVISNDGTAEPTFASFELGGIMKKEIIEKNMGNLGDKKKLWENVIVKKHACERRQKKW